MADDVWCTWSTGTSMASDRWPTWWPAWVSAGTDANATANATGGAGVTTGIWRAWFETGINRPDEAGAVLRADPALLPTQATMEPAPDWTVRSARVAEANRRAEHLLADCLTPGQRRELKRHGRFTVESQHGRRYEIRRGRSGNVAEIDGRRRGRPVLATYCIHPVDQVPDADTMLAQKLLLESDEDRFHRLANRTVIARVGGRR